VTRACTHDQLCAFDGGSGGGAGDWPRGAGSDEKLYSAHVRSSRVAAERTSTARAASPAGYGHFEAMVAELGATVSPNPL
jgi:hypothetical protein